MSDRPPPGLQGAAGQAMRLAGDVLYEAAASIEAGDFSRARDEMKRSLGLITKAGAQLAIVAIDGRRRG